MTTIDKLLVVQDRDRRIRQLSRESEDIPARRKLSEATATLDDLRKGTILGRVVLDPAL